MNETELKVALWLAEHDGEERCRYCKINNSCPHEMKCYGGEPIEPSCASKDFETELLDHCKLISDINNGEWD